MWVKMTVPSTADPGSLKYLWIVEVLNKNTAVIWISSFKQTYVCHNRYKWVNSFIEWLISARMVEFDQFFGPIFPQFTAEISYLEYWYVFLKLISNWYRYRFNKLLPDISIGIGYITISDGGQTLICM